MPLRAPTLNPRLKRSLPSMTRPRRRLRRPILTASPSPSPSLKLILTPSPILTASPRRRLRSLPTSGKAKAAASESDSDSDSGSESAEESAKPKVNGKAKAEADDSSDSSDSSDSEEESDDKATAKKAADSSDSEEDSDDSDDSNEDDAEESDESKTKTEDASASKKRKAEEEIDATPKKAKTDEQAASTLFAGNLSWNIDDNALSEAFKGFEGLVGARVVTDRDGGRSRGFGYVDFETAEAATKAYEAMQGSDPESETLFIGNLPFDTDQETVRQFFAEVAEVASVRLPTDPDSGNLKGFGYVTFTSVEDAKNVFQQLNGAPLGNGRTSRSVRLDFASSRPQQGGGGFGGGRGWTWRAWRAWRSRW
ncbi:nuclear localization sequence binding protein [Metarhizium acridum]|nr:nuclear localization sequence binding protein [Metarhizium acridum]